MPFDTKTLIDIALLIVIAAFVPAITFLGYKMYKAKTVKKLDIILVVLFLGLELLRFVYNATLYPKAAVPSSNLTFTYISFGVVASLFAVFANNRVGRFFRKIVVLTALVPVIMGGSFNQIINLPFDMYTIMKAIYFVEAGLYITLAISFLSLSGDRLKPLDILWGCLYMLTYVGINAMTIHFFKVPITFDLQYYLTMTGVVVSVPLLYGLSIIVPRFDNHNCQEETVSK